MAQPPASAVFGDGESGSDPAFAGKRHARISALVFGASFGDPAPPLPRVPAQPDGALRDRAGPARLRHPHLRVPEMRSRSFHDRRAGSDDLQPIRVVPADRPDDSGQKPTPPPAGPPSARCRPPWRGACRAAATGRSAAPGAWSGGCPTSPGHEPSICGHRRIAAGWRAR